MESYHYCHHFAELWECLYGDKSYISDPLDQELAEKGVTLITGMKKNMKPKVMKL
ncbi:Mobile element protein [Candidatus Enterovibrio escicola]|uniref:Mobile element protein n=1 Tax=Candidatus Enterovibrio escicola TaxID=1927127 RepID=A0A2A5T2I8_9GAMM|nr:Mobile element protein [Candidatus Enterovibrio escacola]